MITITKTNFEHEVLHSAKPVIIDVYSATCHSCRVNNDIINRLAETVTTSSSEDSTSMKNRPSQNSSRSLPFPPFSSSRTGNLPPVHSARDRRIPFSDFWNCKTSSCV